ncbi:MAG: hypothetical protein GY801_52780 [bacterium]|nr:hypothetical protein [bacterium]
MYVDPIVKEIHQIREQHCQQFQYDLHTLLVDVKQREQHSDKRVVNLSTKKRGKSNTTRLTKATGQTKTLAAAC